MMATVAAATITVLSSTAIPASAQTESFVPVTQAMLAHPDPADCLHISRTYNEHRFSPLKQINKSNVAQLRMVWSRGLAVGTQESTPLVYRGVMYVIAPGATVQALDATNGDLRGNTVASIPPASSRGPRAARTSASTRT